MKPKRYARLIELVEQTKPETILEVGVYNGERAMEMAAAALKHHPKVHYSGFDLFEDASPETDSEEFNKKRNHSMESVRSRLAAFQGANPGFAFKLHKGNSRETLESHAVDFAYIDGGHSVETIRGDYEAVKESKVVAFDDYYLPNATGECPDVRRFGANEVVDSLDGARIIDTGDPVAGGGYVCLAIVGA